jgi:hypothetical protein
MRVLQFIGVLTTAFVIGVRDAIAWLLTDKRTFKRFRSFEAIGGLALLQQKRSGSGLTCAIRPYGCAPLEPRLRAW